MRGVVQRFTVYILSLLLFEKKPCQCTSSVFVTPKNPFPTFFDRAHFNITLHHSFVAATGLFGEVSMTALAELIAIYS